MRLVLAELDLRNVPSHISLYRKLTRCIQQLPFDSRTIALLHQFKKYKYQTTKVKNNELYYTKLAIYYINAMRKVIFKQDNEKTLELLNIAYVKTVPTRKRWPWWYMQFLNWSKNDLRAVYEHKLWPVTHQIHGILNDIRAHAKNNKAAKQCNEIEEEYAAYLAKQQKVRNADTSVLDLFPHIDHRGSQDETIARLISGWMSSSAPQSVNETAEAELEKIEGYKAVIAKLTKFSNQIKSSNNIGKITVAGLTVTMPAKEFGTPIPKRRAYNRFVERVRFYKQLMYTKAEPIALRDMRYLEQVAEGLVPVAAQNAAARRLRKRVLNFLRLSYSFDLEGKDDVLVFSKYRVLKSNYYETAAQSKVLHQTVEEREAV